MALVDSDAPGRRSFVLWAGPGTSALRPALRAGARPGALAPAPHMEERRPWAGLTSRL
jgi:hypothetical protein